MADKNKQPDLGEVLARLGDLEVELAAAKKEVTAAREDLVAMKEELENKDRIIAWLQKKMFGKSSERLDPNQLDLDFDEATLGKPEPLPETGDAGGAAEEAGVKRRKTRRKKADLFPRNLPIVIDAVNIPAPVESDPTAYREIGEEHQDTLDIVPASLFWRRKTCKKYIRIDDPGAAPLMCPMPEPALPGTKCAPRLAAQIIVEKYCDHLPHYRQSQRLDRQHGAKIGRATLNAWTHAAARHLIAVGLAIIGELVRADYLQVDETTIDYLSPGNGQTKKGYLWVYHSPQLGLTYYDWRLGRGHQALVDVLGDGTPGSGSYKGHLGCDGFSAYDTYGALRGSDVEIGACLAHIRRKFYEARGQAPAEAKRILTKIQQLYFIEKQLREGGAATPACRLLVRGSRSRPLCEELKELIIAEHGRHLPSSKFGDAISYALGQWEGFERYLRNGVLEIDNNLVENTIRPTKLGAKNYMFFGSAEAGKASALLYTLIDSCKRNDLNPEDYLAEVIERLPENANAEQAAELTPARIAAARRVAEEAA
jgi:transposase